MLNGPPPTCAEANIKTNRRYIFYRYYCVTVALLWNATIIHEVANGSPDNKFPLQIFVLIPFLLPAIFMIFSLGSFKFRYSVFGPLERSKAPKEPPILVSKGTSGQIGWVQGSSPLFSYWLYPTGLEIAMLGTGKAFLPFQYVDEIQSGFLRGYRIIHHSPEIRSPISLPSKEWFNLFRDYYEKFQVSGRAENIK